MNKEFDALVFIGRFQPFHRGHETIIREAEKRSEEVIIIVGSSNTARNTRNPFTFEERKRMIKSVFPQENVKVVPLFDYPYDDHKWIAAVQTSVYSAMKYSPDPLHIGLIGHSKDHSSYYLKIFPAWKSIEVENFQDINATDIRKGYFADGGTEKELNKLSPSVREMLKDFATSDVYANIREEQKIILEYKRSWAVAPYPPVFVTTDAVVTQSGHILLIKRKFAPGKNLWALPGGFLNPRETIENGTLRELREETKLKVPTPVLKGSMKGTKVFDHPDRSERGRTITHATHFDLGFAETLPKVSGSDDAAKAKWIAFSDIQRQHFFDDHFHIIDYFLNIG